MARSDAASTESLQKAWMLQSSGNLLDAEREYRKLLRKHPANADALYGLGTLEAGRRNFAEARALIERSLKLKPASSQAHSSLGVVLSELGQRDLALEHYRWALDLDPSNAEACVNMANALGAQPAARQEALALYDRAISLAPGLLAAYLHRSAMLRMMNDWREALATIDQALALMPRTCALLLDRARTLLAIGHADDALSDVDAAAAIQPGNADVHNLRGVVLQKKEQFDEALASLGLAQILRPEHASAHWNEAICRLTMGDWGPTAWDKYEWGWQSGDRKPVRQLRKPLWTGKESLAGRTILLHDEQGLGDTIQFSRLAASVAAAGATVILQVQPALKGVMTSLLGPHQVIADGEAHPPYDFHCPLFSLPLALGMSVGNIPLLQRPLEAPATHLEQWSTRLAERDPGRTLRVGIAWSGNAAQSDNHKRSIALDQLLGLRAGHIEFVSLQKVATEAEVALLQREGVRHFGDELRDFSDTAALVAHVDLVISVCTSVAHLAASMSKPTWILLARQPCWRWLSGRDDTPWYPSARLFRQQAQGEWQVPLQQLKQALHALPAT